VPNSPSRKPPDRRRTLLVEGDSYRSASGGVAIVED
jgi:hypothetical protein